MHGRVSSATELGFVQAEAFEELRDPPYMRGLCGVRGAHDRDLLVRQVDRCS